MMGDYSIGQLARQTGYAVQTLRYYEDIGLLPPPPRSTGGQRRYASNHLKRLSFIKHARELGFDIPAVRALLALSEHPDEPCADADRIASEHLTLIDEKIRQLQEMRAEVTRMIAACGQASIARCAVIEGLAEPASQPAQDARDG